MVLIRLLPLLLLLVYPLYSRGDDRNCGDLRTEVSKIVSMVSELANLVKSQTEILKSQSRMVKAQGEKIEDQEENIRDLRKGLDKRLRENDLKIEWALTDGTLAPKNTSGIIKNLARQEEKIDRALDMLSEAHGFTYPAASCAEINDGDAQGIHLIYPNHTLSDKVFVNCAATAGGGWTVIQRRFDGSIDFYRGWEEYAEGFGHPAGEHWLGLHHIHALTKDQPMELYVSLTDFDLGFRYAKYTPFSVSSEEDKFRLFIGAYSGNAGDSLTYHNGSSFSTKDQDNDSYRSNCATRYHGAWWYNRCHYANLNGLFSPVKVNGGSYMSWRFLQTNNRAMKASLMMIRPSNFHP